MANTKTEAVTETKPQRRARTPVSGARDILTITNKSPEYHYRWVKDLPGRIQRFLDAGYEFVIDNDARVGGPAVDNTSKVGSTLTRVTGANTLVAMRQRLEWYNEDQEAKHDELDRLEDILFGEGLKGVSRDDSWQPTADFGGKKADR